LRGLEELEGGGVWELAGKPVTFNWGIRGWNEYVNQWNSS
jgi:hypothetical protein